MGKVHIIFKLTTTRQTVRGDTHTQRSLALFLSVRELFNFRIFVSHRASSLLCDREVTGNLEKEEGEEETRKWNNIISIVPSLHNILSLLGRQFNHSHIAMDQQVR